jgi:sugar phosphate isomerase/epimerase
LTWIEKAGVLTMSEIQVACQTYTWEMLGDGWQGRVTELLDWISDAGYAGIEITNTMIGEFADQPTAFAEALDKRGLKLAAFAYATGGFSDRDRYDDDLAGAQKVLDFLAHFDQPRLGLGGAAHASKGFSASEQKQNLDQAIRFYNEVGRHAFKRGISVNVHPHSHHGSLLESPASYAYLMARLDPELVSLGPDTGHIVRGGQELLPCLQTYIERISHLHLKDVTGSGEWVPLGEGVCDFPAVMALLESVNYTGWIVAEEESAAAARDGQAAIQRNRAYLKKIGY